MKEHIFHSGHFVVVVVVGGGGVFFFFQTVQLIRQKKILIEMGF